MADLNQPTETDSHEEACTSCDPGRQETEPTRQESEYDRLKRMTLRLLILFVVFLFGSVSVFLGFMDDNLVLRIVIPAATLLIAFLMGQNYRKMRKIK